MKKFRLNIFIIVIISFVVIFFSLKDNFSDKLNYITNLNPLILIIAFLFMFLNILFQSLSLHNFVKKIKPEYKLKNALFLTTAGLFFNGITPFSSGGQPFQVYLLKKDDVKVSDSTNILLQNFLTYQISLVLIGTIAIIINSVVEIFPPENLLKNAVIIGYIVNLFVLFLIFFFSYAKKFNTNFFNKISNFIFKFKFIKNKEKLKKQFNESIDNFYNGTVNLKNNLKNFIISFLYNTLSLICLYIVPLFVFYAMGELESLNLLESLVASGYTYLIGSFVPIPGGSGGLEYSFIDFFKVFRAGNFLSAAMLIWRFITYYFGMFLGAISLMLYKKEE